MTTTRTTEEIYRDICDITTLMPNGEWERFYADKTRRLHALWSELHEVIRADQDNTPAWAGLAVALVRGMYEREEANL